MLKYILLWLPMVPIAVANGAARQLWYGKHMAELTAHQVSTCTGILLLGVYMWRVFAAWPLASAGQAAAVGLAWVALTVAFEFLFGHYLAKQPWTVLLANYNVFRGHLWPLVLAWVGFAPYLFFKAR
jgi:hypothetical protein